MRKQIRRRLAFKNIPFKNSIPINHKIEPPNSNIRQSNKVLTKQIDNIKTLLIEKEKSYRITRCRKVFNFFKHHVNLIMESVIFHIIVLALSIFSLFNNDVMTTFLPTTFDSAFHHINEFIFIFFLLELILFSLFKDRFFGSFYFYLDIVALISLLPEVSFIWNPLSVVLTGNVIEKDDPTMSTIVSNLHLVKASRTSQLGSKASKYIKLLRLLNFLKIARLSKVVEESQKLKRENLNFLTNFFSRVNNANKHKNRLLPLSKHHNAKAKKGMLIRFNSNWFDRMQTKKNLKMLQTNFSTNKKLNKMAKNTDNNNNIKNSALKHIDSPEKNEVFNGDRNLETLRNEKTIYPKTIQTEVGKLNEEIYPDYISLPYNEKKNQQTIFNNAKNNGLLLNSNPQMIISDYSKNDVDGKIKGNENTILNKTELKKIRTFDPHKEFSKIQEKKRFGSNKHLFIGYNGHLTKNYNSIKNYSTFEGANAHDNNKQKNISFMDFKRISGKNLKYEVDPKSPIENEKMSEMHQNTIRPRSKLTNLNFMFKKRDFINSSKKLTQMGMDLSKNYDNNKLKRFSTKVHNIGFNTPMRMNSFITKKINFNNIGTPVSNTRHSLGKILSLENANIINDNYIKNMIKDQINQFCQSDFEAIFNISLSDEENIIKFENPLKLELNKFLIDNNLDYNDLFSNGVEAYSYIANYFIEDSEIIDDDKFEDHFKKINLFEVLNERGEEEEIDSLNEKKLEKFSSFDSSKTDSQISLGISQNSEDDKNKKALYDINKNHFNLQKSNIKCREKNPDFVYVDKNMNSLIDFYGDLKYHEEKNFFSNAQEKNTFNSNYNNHNNEKKVLYNNFNQGPKNNFKQNKKNVKFIDDETKEEINLIKKNKNKFKKLNIEVEEVIETPTENGSIKNSKLKKITKTEYVKEEKIYQVKNNNRYKSNNSGTYKENITHKNFNKQHEKDIDENISSHIKKKDNYENSVANKQKLLSLDDLNIKNRKDSQECSSNININSSDQPINVITTENNVQLLNPENKSYNISNMNSSDTQFNNQSKKIDLNIKKDEQEKNGHSLSRTNKITLEESLMAILTQKVVVLILLLLILLPILGGDYVKSFLFNTDDTEIKNYCMEVIPSLFSLAIENPSILACLQKHVEKCEMISIDKSEESDFDSQDPYFLYLNFTDFIPYNDLILKYNKTNYSKFFPNIAYDNFTKRENAMYLREGYDFYTDYYFDITHTDEENSKITFIYNNRIFLVIDNVTGILKSIFVGVVLVWGAFVVSNDVTKLLIIPLDKVKAKMNYLLGHSDEVFMKPDKIKEQSKNVVHQLVKNENIDKNIKKNFLKEDWEFRVLNSSVVSLINLVSMSLGQNMLKILSSLKANEKYKLNWVKEGIKFKSCYMIVKMTNLDNLVKNEQEKAILIINKMHYIIQSIAKTYLGEINQSNDTIYWTEDIDEVYFKKIAYYLKLAGRSDEEIERELEIIQEIYNLPKFYQKNLIINLAIFCANKIIASFVNNLFETFHKFLNSGARINFVIDYGEVNNGLVGTDHKINEVIFSSSHCMFSHLIEKINYDLPSIIVSNTIYENLSKKIKENFFVSDIILTELKKNGSSKREIIHRQYIDFSSKKLYEKKNIENFKKNDVYIFMKQSQINSEAILFYENLKQNKDAFDDFIINDTEHKFNTNFINNSILNSINAVYLDILNKEFTTALKKIKKILKWITTYNENFEYNISQNIKNLEKYLESYESNLKKKGLFYTIDMSGSNIFAE